MIQSALLLPVYLMYHISSKYGTGCQDQFWWGALFRSLKMPNFMSHFYFNLHEKVELMMYKNIICHVGLCLVCYLPKEGHFSVANGENNIC